jgi:hypothetical protein
MLRGGDGDGWGKKKPSRFKTKTKKNFCPPKIFEFVFPDFVTLKSFIKM